MQVYENLVKGEIVIHCIFTAWKNTDKQRLGTDTIKTQVMLSEPHLDTVNVQNTMEMYNNPCQKPFPKTRWHSYLKQTKQ